MQRLRCIAHAGKPRSRQAPIGGITIADVIARIPRQAPDENDL
jgi:hypothetical protein